MNRFRFSIHQTAQEADDAGIPRAEGGLRWPKGRDREKGWPQAPSRRGTPAPNRVRHGRRRFIEPRGRVGGRRGGFRSRERLLPAAFALTPVSQSRPWPRGANRGLASRPQSGPKKTYGFFPRTAH